MRKLLTSIFILISSLVWVSYAQEIKEPKKAEKKQDKKTLPAAYQKFLDEVHWIISDYEKEAFYVLENDEDRNRFIEMFWENRDPTPGTKSNEFKDEHHERFEYANKFYGRESSLPGWKTDRGKVYILLGKPEFTKRIQASMDNHPMELWHYVGYRGYGLPGSLYLLFYQQYGSGPYRLYSPLQDTIRNLFIMRHNIAGQTDNHLFGLLRENVDPEIAHASISAIPSESADPSYMGTSVSTEVVMAKLGNARNYDVSRRKYVEDILKDRPSVKVYYSIFSEGIHDAVYWFQAPNGYYYIDYTVEYEPDKLDMGFYDPQYYTSLTVDGLVAAPDKTEVEQIIGTHEIKINAEQFHKIKSIPFQLQGRRPLVPGKYTFTLIVSNNVSQKSATFVRDIEIPDSAKAKAPVVTPPIPIRSVEQAPQDNKTRPFQFGDKLLIPNVSADYSQSGGMQLFHQILFPDQYSPSGALTLHYIVRSGESVEMDLTEPIQVASSELAGNSLEIRKDLQLTKLVPGAKQLTVELRDNAKTVSRTQPITFTVLTQLPTGSWKFAVALPGFETGYHQLLIGNQLMRLKRFKEALAILEQSHLKNPDSLDVTFTLMRAAIREKNFQRAIELGIPIEIKNPRNQDALWLMGWSYYGLAKYEDAVKMFERLRIEKPTVEVLNLLADCYYRLERPDKSLERLQQSLALRPDQKDMLELKKKLETNR